jgi:hypothetical protein
MLACAIVGVICLAAGLYGGYKYGAKVVAKEQAVIAAVKK